MAGFAPDTGTSLGSIFIKREGDARSRFAKVPILDGDAVTDLAERASQKRGWNVDAAYVELFLVPAESEDEPSAAEEEEALKQPRLGVGWSLPRAGIISGAWVIARLTDSPAAVPGKCAREPVSLSFRARAAGDRRGSQGVHGIPLGLGAPPPFLTPLSHPIAGGGGGSNAGAGA